MDAKIITLPVLPKAGGPITATQVERIEAGVIAALPMITDRDEAEEWRRKAKAIEAYLRSPELQKPMLGAQRRVEARIGELLGPVDQGRRTDLELFPHEGKVVVDLVNKNDATAFRLLARAFGECDLALEDWRKSRRALVSFVRNKLGLMPETPDLPAGKFSCLVVDPPWKLDTGPDTFAGTGENGHDALSYEQLSVEKITKLTDKHGRPFSDLPADDAHLYLWTTNKYIEASYSIARAWGFKPSVMLTWCKKPRGVGLGDTFRLTTEFVLFCRRGNFPHRKIIPTTWFEWPRGKHSAKPDEFYEMVQSVTPSKWPERTDRIDLFARKKREGWLCWGDEVAEG